jgi:DNA-binding transcriptional ArsR family regulator
LTSSSIRSLANCCETVGWRKDKIFSSSVTELETILSMRQPTVSQQLARLRLDGLVTTRREGKTVYYSIGDEKLRRVITVIYDIFCREDGVGRIRD